MKIRYAAIAAIGLLVGLSSSPVLAEGLTQKSTSGLRVLAADGRDSGHVRFLIVDDDPSLTPDQFKIRENGKEITGVDEVGHVKDSALAAHTVIVLDSSQANLADGRQEALKEAAISFIHSKGNNESFALIKLQSDEATLVEDFTSDGHQLTTDIAALEARGERRLHDGVQKAANLLHGETGSNNIVVITSGDDVNSTANLKDISAKIKNDGVGVFTIGMNGPDGFAPDSIESLSGLVHGTYINSKTVEGFQDVESQTRDTFDQQWLVGYRSLANVFKQGEDPSAVLNVEITAGKEKQSITFTGGLLTFADELNPKAVDDGIAARVLDKYLGFLGGPIGLLVVGVMLLGATGLLVFTIIRLTDRRSGSLDRVLSPYLEGPADADEDEDDEAQDLHVETAFMKSAVAKTEKLARERGILNWVIDALQKADINVHPSEAILLALVGVTLFSVAGLAAGGPAGFLIGAVISTLSPFAFLKLKAARRRAKFEGQLPNTLQLLASALRAGYSILQGLESVSHQIDDPMARELRQSLAEARLGRPVEDALEEMALRVQSDDFAWTVLAIKIQRDVGGNLAELLDSVTETMIQRERLRREVKALTAEGRISAIILGILPPGLGAVLYVIRPDYIMRLFEDSIGQFLVGAAVVMGLAGFYWMKKMLELDI